MGSSTPSKIEAAAIETISAVTNAADYKHLEPAGGPTPDWQLTLGDGSVACVEVTACVNQAETELFAAVHAKDGSPKEWPSDMLSYRWSVIVTDRDPDFNKRRRSLQQVADDAVTVLSMVEATGGTPEQLAKIASDLFNGDDVAFRATEETMHLLHVDGLQLEGRDRSGRDRSQILAVGLRNPEWVGEGKGSVELYPITSDGSSGTAKLRSDVQDAINRKTKKQQMDGCCGGKWLAVMVEGLAAFQLNDYYGPGSRYYDRNNAQHPALNGITFDYFDEVWVCSWHPVALRLVDGGAKRTVHHLN